MKKPYWVGLGAENGILLGIFDTTIA